MLTKETDPTNESLPCMRNPEDPHQFSVVGLHLDLRVQVMPMAALRRVAREVAALGYNTIVMEWEASFPFDTHAIISNEFAYTPQEVAEFVAYCDRLGLTVIPVQQCFGHVEYVLRHNRYADLREDRRDFCQLCPEKADRALEVFGGILREIADAHPAPYLHIGGDETYLLGRCESCRAKAEKEGRSKLYVDYFKRIAACVTELKKTPLLWADMLLRHPEAAHEMPRETVFVDWNYGWPVDRFGDPKHLERTDFRFWGAAALRSSPDNHWLTCWQRHFENLRNYIPYTKKMRFEGILLTSWSTSGGYGYQWDSERDAMELYPIRRVYPLAGFRILLVAFARAVQRAGAFDPEAFVVEYAAERFGLTRAAGKQLWKALILGEDLAKSGADPALASKLAARAKAAIHRLQPRRNKREFEHLRLMADLRDHHLQTAEIDAQANSERFKARQAPALSARLEPLLAEAKKLGRRFASLNRGEVYPAEMLQEEAYRFGRLKLLHARLSRLGRQKP